MARGREHTYVVAMVTVMVTAKFILVFFLLVDVVAIVTVIFITFNCRKINFVLLLLVECCCYGNCYCYCNSVLLD